MNMLWGILELIGLAGFAISAAIGKTQYSIAFMVISIYCKLKVMSED